MYYQYDRESNSNGHAERTSMTIRKRKESRLHEVDLDNPGFGVEFSDHMYSVEYRDGEWQDPEIVPYGAIQMQPATCTLHYGQAVFEGLKAFHTRDGAIRIFRPEAHHARFRTSCRRLCIPEPDYEQFIEALNVLLDLDQAWVPENQGYALYIRPFIYAMDEYLAVKVAESYKFLIITSPVGAYYEEGFNPVSLITAEKYVRAVKGGVGTVKTLGNYSASLRPAQEAKEQGFTQVLWLDAFEHRYIEEVGTMNIFFLIDDVLVTPKLEGTILPGVTRDSVLQIAEDWGVPTEERRITIDELFEAADSGKLQEVFGTGTAAVISPVGLIQHRDRQLSVNGNDIGPFAKKLFDEITGIQHGEKEDRFGWMHTVTSEKVEEQV